MAEKYKKVFHDCGDNLERTGLIMMKELLDCKKGEGIKIQTNDASFTFVRTS